SDARRKVADDRIARLEEAIVRPALAGRGPVHTGDQVAGDRDPLPGGQLDRAADVREDLELPPPGRDRAERRPLPERRDLRVPTQQLDLGGGLRRPHPVERRTDVDELAYLRRERVAQRDRERLRLDRGDAAEAELLHDRRDRG